MRVLVIGQGLDDDEFKAIVDATSTDMVRRELIECMGMRAHTTSQYIEQLQEIGFVVYEYDGVYDGVVSVPINLSTRQELF